MEICPLNQKGQVAVRWLVCTGFASGYVLATLQSTSKGCVRVPATNKHESVQTSVGRLPCFLVGRGMCSFRMQFVVCVSNTALVVVCSFLVF